MFGHLLLNQWMVWTLFSIYSIFLQYVIEYWLFIFCATATWIELKYISYTLNVFYMQQKPLGPFGPCFDIMLYYILI